jgi:hypothetical protein
MYASGFLPSVEMTDAGEVHEYRSLSRAPDRHSEPWARNPEAAMLGVHALVLCPFAPGLLAHGSHARGNDTAVWSRQF